MLAAGVLAYQVLTVVWPVALTLWLAACAVVWAPRSVRRAVLRGVAHSARWAWRRRTAAARERARAAALTATREHQAVTGGDAPTAAVTGAADVAAIEAGLVEVVARAEHMGAVSRPAIRARIRR
jgi:hypothetical protein